VRARLHSPNPFTEPIHRISYPIKLKGERPTIPLHLARAWEPGKSAEAFRKTPAPVSVFAARRARTNHGQRTSRECDGALEALADYAGDDIAYGVEGWWDLWQYDSRQKQDDWKLAPARVSLACFGPDFDNGTERFLGEQEDLRIDFGVDSHYLPRLDLAGSGRMTESNLKSMLRLVHELDSQLPVAKRKLETESGENFADRLQEVMGGSRS